MGAYGVYGESAVVPAFAVAPYPGSLSPVEGTAIWMQYVTEEQDLAAGAMEITSGKGVSLVFDPVAGPYLEKIAEAAAPGATIFEYGALSLTLTPFPLFQVLGKIVVII